MPRVTRPSGAPFDDIDPEYSGSVLICAGHDLAPGNDNYQLAVATVSRKGTVHYTSWTICPPGTVIGGVDISGNIEVDSGTFNWDDPPPYNP